MRWQNAAPMDAAQRLATSHERIEIHSASGCSAGIYGKRWASTNAAKRGSNS